MQKPNKYFCYFIVILYSLISRSDGAIYTYEDVELRRIFPSEFPQDVVRKSGSADPEQLGRYAELEHYFKSPRSRTSSHFEELNCRSDAGRKVCKLNLHRYSPQEDAYFKSRSSRLDHMDPHRVYCFMLICFTEDELQQVVASFD